MPNISKDKIYTQGDARVFVQPGGARPNNAVRYSGRDGQQMAITGVSVPVRGGVEPIIVHDPGRFGGYARIGRTTSPPGEVTFTVQEYEERGFLSRMYYRAECAYTYYRLVGQCANPSDFVRGWNGGYVEIMSQAIMTERSGGDRAPFSSDEAITNEASFSAEALYQVGPISFGEKAATEVEREVRAVTYGNSTQCADCGPENDGTEHIYAVATFDSGSSIDAELIYSTDGGLSWTAASIVSNVAPVAIGIVDDRLIVVGTTAVYYATINTKTGVPGSFTANTVTAWTTNPANDAAFIGPADIYVAADNGYVYKFDDITTQPVAIEDGTATSSNLERIAVAGAVIVAAGPVAR